MKPRLHEWSNTADCRCLACGLRCPVDAALTDPRFNHRTGVWADDQLPAEYVVKPCKGPARLRLAS